MTELAYIYLVQAAEDKGTQVYKIGKTVQKGGDGRYLQRLRGYSKGTVIFNVWKVDELLVDIIERRIKDDFRKRYLLIKGTEWFQGNINDMKKDIDQVMDSTLPQIQPESSYNAIYQPDKEYQNRQVLCAIITSIANIYQK